jgi:hypothetical protein
VSRAALAVLALLLAGACGHKGPVVAPELVRPEPPTDVAAAPTPEGVRLTWTRPTKYAGGQRMRDLGSFLVERADADAEPPAFARVGTIELQDQTRLRQERRFAFVDYGVEPGRSYVYRVTARTLDGYTSAAAGPVRVRFTPPPVGPPAPPAAAP